MAKLFKLLFMSRQYDVCFRDVCRILAEGDIISSGPVFALSEAGIVGSNPPQGMDVCIVCVYSVFVLSCV
jgi:hypothetical protein